MAAKDEQPIQLQGFFNQILQGVIIASLVWVGGKIDRSSDGLTAARIELTHVKETLKTLAEDRDNIVAGMKGISLNEERLRQNDMRIQEMTSRVYALEKIVMELSKNH
ncbi:hypothetical protein [Shewanella gaetbuli]|uniref:Uncharacterized protein n=1 Tax=Shewanella gaetbuli TaxID=220752 RepID=A0A9X1ZII3_9GAMM|nr:hypothetical protein [Shewanella gaetbuli]MCL1142974.1 hypothetical protein [Shewanella gaetbuli]